MRLIPPQAVDLIREFEGLSLTSYKDSGGIWTIGYGRTNGVREGMVINEETAISYLMEDMRESAQAVEKYVKTAINDNQFAALISFVYNVGVGNFKTSTLLRVLNNGWYEQVPKQLMRWCKVKDEIVGGLHRRRAAEVELFNKRDEGFGSAPV